MFFNAPKNPTKLKHVVYLISATILGVLLSFIAHALIEMAYLSWAYKNNYAVTFYGGCALPWELQIGLVLAGIVGGFLLGRWWWRLVYVEKKYEDETFLCGTPFVRRFNKRRSKK